jgi:DNA-binding NarL/FixJ family response regulator
MGIMGAYGEKPSSSADPLAVPTYRTIAARARQLRELGMSDRAIARSLGVSDKTIAKAIRLEALR